MNDILDELRCVFCDTPLELDDLEASKVCKICISKLPASLIKANFDAPFKYAMKLRDGSLVHFSAATIIGDWVHIVGTEENVQEIVFEPSDVPLTRPRGMDVRIADIMWCADAPRGS